MTILSLAEVSYCIDAKTYHLGFFDTKRTAEKVEHLILTYDQNSQKKSRTAEYRSRLAKLSIQQLIFQKKTEEH